MNWMEDSISFEAKLGDGMAFFYAGGSAEGEGFKAALAECWMEIK